MKGCHGLGDTESCFIIYKAASIDFEFIENGSLLAVYERKK